MNRKTDEITSDVDHLGMTLGKRLGRLEVSGVEILEQLVGLVDRCEVVEDALVEEHVARETDEKRIQQVEERVAELEKVVSKIKGEKSKENDLLETKFAKLEEEQREFKKNFLELVESCQGMEEKVKLVEGINVKLVEEVKDLQKQKETLVKSLTNNPNVSNYSTTLDSPPTPLVIHSSSSIISNGITPALLTKPSPTMGAVARRMSPQFQVRTL